MSNLGTHRRCVCMLSPQADVSKLLGSGAASALDLAGRRARHAVGERDWSLAGRLQISTELGW